MSKQKGDEELVLSATVGKNSSVFSNVEKLYFEQGDRIVDVTHGEGVFWKEVDEGPYTVVKADINPNKSPYGEAVDCRDTPFADNSFDVVVLDPPYSSGHYRQEGERTSKSDFPQRYGVPKTLDLDELPKYHGAVRMMYSAAGAEAARILKSGGLLIVKVMDEVVNHNNYLTHVEVINDYKQYGFNTKDLFVVVREDTPTVVGMDNQVHARKNHSYFIILKLNDSR